MDNFSTSPEIKEFALLSKRRSSLSLMQLKLKFRSLHDFVRNFDIQPRARVKLTILLLEKSDRKLILRLPTLSEEKVRRALLL